ncbi:partial pH-gated potassium channel KcsA, partial [Planctomycetaceae bacterium]
TVFTVGYGDIAPKSHSGRLFAGMLILFGVGLISLLTANLAAFLIGSEVEKVEKEEKEADVLLKDLAVRMERIERLLEQNQQRGGKANTQDVPLD